MLHCKFLFLFARKQVAASKAEAEKDGVQVPTSVEEYCIRTKAEPTNSSNEMTDFYDDDYADDLEDTDEEDSDAEYCDADDDSGNGES